MQTYLIHRPPPRVTGSLTMLRAGGKFKLHSKPWADWLGLAVVPLAALMLLANCISSKAAVGDPSEPVAYAGTDDTDINYADGGHRVAVGVQNYQILRSMGNDIDHGDGFNWTYHHSPMMHYWNGRLYVSCNSTPKDEDTLKGHCLLMTSTNLAVTWSRPVVLFPEQWVTAEGVAQWTTCNMRLGFWTSPNGKLYAQTCYYPVTTGNDPAGGDDCNRKWFGVAVREIRSDGTFGDIYYVADNPSLYSRPSLPFPYYTNSPDSVFRGDCDLMRGNPLVSLDWWEHLRPENFNFPASLVSYIAIKGDRTFAKAFSYFHRPDNAVVALWKFGYSALSYDEGLTWTQPVVLPTLGSGYEKVWGQQTEDENFAVSWKPPAAPARYPLIVATGSDGKNFDGSMLCVNGEAYKRYDGKSKSYGPANYQRGLLEGNSHIPGTDMWMAYSMSKEDIWISRIPVPIRGSVTNHVNDNFNNLAAGGVVTDWNIYSPLYAPVRVVEYPSASDRSLELRDMDPFDFAKAERVFPESQRVRLSFKVLAKQTSGRLDMEVRSQTPGGFRPVRIWFAGDGQIMAMIDSNDTSVALGNYQPDMWYSLVVDVDTGAQNYSVQINGSSVLTGARYADSETISSVERLSFRTGEWRPLNLSGPYVDPNLDHPVPATVFNVDDVVSFPGGGTPSFTATADAYVNSAVPTNNFGPNTSLEVHQSATRIMESYLRFSVSGLSGMVTAAKLRLKESTAGNSSSNNSAMSVRSITGSWTETGVKWANKPAYGTTSLGSVPANSITNNQVVEIALDVSHFTTNGTYNLALIGTSDGNDTPFNSREATADKPQLILTTLPLSVQGRILNGQFEATTTVVQGVTCEWQVSSDLIHWTPVLTNTATVSGPLILREDLNGTDGGRFYRVQYRQ